MNYFINEYSLRGQFGDVNEFFCSLREKTLPVLKKIEDKKDNVIWKKDTFWQSEICPEIRLNNIPQKRNERSIEMTALRTKLIKLTTLPPFWDQNTQKSEVCVEEYQFDVRYRKKFSRVNCFTEAIDNDGRVISFEHLEYQNTKLPIMIRKDSNNIVTCILDNIYEVKWWKKEPEVKTWRLLDKYIIEVRANEFEYHPPHFHVSYNEYSAVFRLKDGALYKSGKKAFPMKMLEEIRAWYIDNKNELLEAWNVLHIVIES